MGDRNNSDSKNNLKSEETWTKMSMKTTITKTVTSQKEEEGESKP